MNRVLALLLFMLIWGSSTAQTSVYRTRVLTIDGERLVGTLTEVTDAYLFIDGFSVPLRNVRKVVLSRIDKGRNGLLAGAIVGGIGVGYLTNRSLQNERVSNGVLYGVSLVMGAAAGAAIGSTVGNAVDKLSRSGRVVLRPRAGGETSQSLARQLKPFSRDYHENLLNNVPNSLKQ